MSTPEDIAKPRRSTLERATARTLSFLLAVGRNPVVRGLLETHGYTAAEHADGWRLLRAVDPTAPPDGKPRSEGDPAVRVALAHLDAWGHRNLPILDLALRRREPAVHAFLFARGIAPADGVESVRVIALFFQRVDALVRIAGGAADEAIGVTPKQARGALAIMAARGVGNDAQEAVHSWLALVQRGAAPAAPAAVGKGSGEAALAALHDWLTEWSLIARKVLTRKDHLVALGLTVKKPLKRDALTPA